jgi:hypothetical protein
MSQTRTGVEQQRSSSIAPSLSALECDLLQFDACCLVIVPGHINVTLHGRTV